MVFGCTLFQQNDIFLILARKWPEEVKKGILAGEGNYPSKPNVNFDMEEFTKTYGGFKLKGVEAFLDALVPQYLELLEKEKSESASA